DGIASSSVATVVLTVQDTAPVAVDQAYSVNQNGQLAPTAAQGLLNGGTSYNGNPRTPLIPPGGNPGHGTVSINPDGSFVYTPNTGFFGNDTFQYQVTDQTLLSNVATVTITVNQIDIPQALNDTYTTQQGVNLVVTSAQGVLVNDSDPLNHNALLTASL